MNFLEREPTQGTIQERLKIFVSAYACEPNLGSEIGVGWHWVLEMSHYFDLWVLTRESNRHTIEPWMVAHPEYADIHWIYYDLPRWARWWKKGLRGVRTYYNIWQFCTNRLVKQTMQNNDIQVFHHLTYGNALWRVSSYGQKQLFVWGPIGGLETIPDEFTRHYDWKSRCVEWIRRSVVRCAAWNWGLNRRCQHADLILCKTAITRDALPKRAWDKIQLFTDVATDITKMEGIPASTDHSVTEFISVGRLDAWRGFDLIIEAIGHVVKAGKPVHLTLVGDGADKTRLQRLISRLHLDNQVSLLGNVPMQTYQQLMKQADVVVNAALKEGAVTVSFDAMAMGKPLICLDTTGYTRYFQGDHAICIPQTSRQEVIQSMTTGMIRMTDPDERYQIGKKAQMAARQISWKQHGQEIRDIILTTYHQLVTKRREHGPTISKNPC